jgi:cell division protein FtsQ
MTERSRLRSPAVFTMVVVVAVAAGGWLALGSPFFAVERVVVRGVRHLEQDQVRSLAGIGDGANLIRLSLDEVAARVERDPWVAAAEAFRDLPSTLVIAVRERRASGWLDADGTALIVAGDGTVLEDTPSPPASLPALGGATDPAVAGGRLGRSPLALRVTGSMPRELLRLTRAAEEEDGEIVTLLRGGGSVRYGVPIDLPEKHRAVLSILSWAEERDMTIGTVDVRIPSAPTLQPPGGGARIELPEEAAGAPTPSP